MSTPENPTAFPFTCPTYSEMGMALRDYFAIRHWSQAHSEIRTEMQLEMMRDSAAEQAKRTGSGAAFSEDFHPERSILFHHRVAERAYEYADAMLAERAKN